jgi:site-specific recombinase XerD
MTNSPRASAPTFSQAASRWLQEHRRYIKPNTAGCYEDALKPLGLFFGDQRLDVIEIKHVRAYQDYRSAQVTPLTTNRELGVFQLVLKEFDQWARLQSRYKPLKVEPHRSGNSLTREEEERLKTVAFSKKKWRLAAHCMVIMMNTTMGFGELRQLRRRDVDMARPCVTVREGAKNEYRQRTIPLNAAARESMEYILKRWAEIGGSSAEHYILPHRPRGNQALHWRKKIPWILDEPTTSMNSAFCGIRKAACLPRFRIYDCRVQAITNLLSSPKVSPQASREIAGHISQAMQNRYSIQTFATKKAALDTLDAPPPGPENSEATVAASGGRIIAFPGKRVRA